MVKQPFNEDNADRRAAYIVEDDTCHEQEEVNTSIDYYETLLRWHSPHIMETTQALLFQVGDHESPRRANHPSTRLDRTSSAARQGTRPPSPDITISTLGVHVQKDSREDPHDQHEEWKNKGRGGFQTRTTQHQYLFSSRALKKNTTTKSAAMITASALDCTHEVTPKELVACIDQVLGFLDIPLPSDF